MKKKAIPKVSESVIIHSLRFNNYELYEDETISFMPVSHRYFIIGYNGSRPVRLPIEVLDETAIEDIYVVDSGVLESLITLASKYISYDSSGFFKEDYNFLVKDIIKWCRKYGLPFVDTDIPQCTSLSTGRYHEATQTFSERSGYIGCSVETFIYRLRDIYNKFLMAMPELAETETFSHDTKWGFNNPYCSNPCLALKDEREREIEILLNGIQLSKRFEFVDGQLQVFFETDDYLSLATYQLGVFIANPGGTQYRRYKDSTCKALFAMKNGNERYCGDCSPQKEYARKKRAAAKNGNKE